MANKGDTSPTPRTTTADEQIVSEIVALLERPFDRGLAANPPKLLGEIVTLLEQPDTKSHRRALYELLTHGPFYCAVEAIRQTQTRSAEVIDQIAGVLLGYARAAVKLGATRTPIDLTGVQISTSWVKGQAISFTTGPLQGLAAMNWATLMHTVGLRDIWPCGATDCPHLFVKIHRRKFCSERCEKRVNKRLKREAERQAAAAAAQTKWRRRVTAQGKK